MKLTKTLFLVDDDVDEHELFEMALDKTAMAIQLITANDGVDALEKLNSNSVAAPDLIFLDLNMPKMNGIQFLEKIKSTNDYKGIPVFIYTTSSATEDRQRALSLGAASFFTKPDNLEELSRTIKAAASGIV